MKGEEQDCPWRLGGSRSKLSNTTRVATRARKQGSRNMIRTMVKPYCGPLMPWVEVATFVTQLRLSCWPISPSLDVYHECSGSPIYHMPRRPTYAPKSKRIGNQIERIEPETRNPPASHVPPATSSPTSNLPGGGR